MLKRICLAAGLLLAVHSSSNAADWPAFRGPTGLGVSTEKSFPTEWSKEQNVKWRVELDGGANSSPIVSGGRVFVTTATEKGKNRTLLCFDRKDGSQLWAKTVEFPAGKQTHATNPYSGSTPVADGKQVVVWHGSAGLFCYDFDGKELWSKELGAVGHQWGYGSSPVLYRGMVILNFGPGVDTFVTALSLEDGKILWKKEEPGGANGQKPRLAGSWSTPIIAQVEGKDQIICSMPKRVVAYDPDTGDILWSVDGLPSSRGDLVYASPLIAGDIGVAMGGYKGPAIGFKLGGSGNVTENNRLWKTERPQPQRIGSGVVSGKHIFIANAGPGTAQCIEIETGKTVWQHQLGGAHWGSTILAGGNLYVTNQGGTTQVFLPDAEKFVEVASNELDERSNSTPAFSDGQIFLRTYEALYCIGK